MHCEGVDTMLSPACWNRLCLASHLTGFHCAYNEWPHIAAVTAAAATHSSLMLQTRKISW